MSLAATKRLLREFSYNRSNHCCPKRLKPEHQTAALRPQYVRTKTLYRSAAARVKMKPEPVIAIPAVTNVK
jgi:hypothetical protein